MMTEARKNPVVDEKFMGIRRERVSNKLSGEEGGTRHYEKIQMVDVIALVQEAEEKYNDDFVMATFTPLWEFADERCLTTRFKKGVDDQALEDFIVNVLKLTVKTDKYGTRGVLTKDQDGGKYRTKTGIRDFISSTKDYKPATNEQARDLADHLADAMQERASGSGHRQAPPTRGKDAEGGGCRFLFRVVYSYI